MVSTCAEVEPPFKAPDNAITLITSDSTKRWKLAKRYNNGHRMNMGDCFLSYRVTYSNELQMWDNNSEHSECGKSLKAAWELITNEGGSFLKLHSDLLPELLNTEDSYKYFKINALSENELILQFKHQQFSDKSTVIIDHLVPEQVHVEDREFHY